MKEPRFAVLGAGNGGQAFAGHLASLGYDVSLFDVEPERVSELRKRGVIELEGALAVEGRPRLVTSELESAVEGTNVVMLVVPACYQESLAERLAPHLSDDQMIVLHPGATGGALAVRQVFRKLGKAAVPVAETGTLLYACRTLRVGEVRVFAVKDEVSVAVLPSARARDVLEALSGPFRAFTAVPNVLHTSLGNLNPVVHPAPTLLNLGRIESGQSFEFYREGMTKAIATVVETLDDERLAVGRAYGMELPSLVDALGAFYGVERGPLYDVLRTSRAHEGVLSPTSVDTRYLFEDVPTGLVPLSELGRAARVETPTMKAVADLACAVLGRDFWKEGRTLARLGLGERTVEEILATVEG